MLAPRPGTPAPGTMIDCRASSFENRAMILMDFIVSGMRMTSSVFISVVSGMAWFSPIQVGATVIPTSFGTRTGEPGVSERLVLDNYRRKLA